MLFRVFLRRRFHGGRICVNDVGKLTTSWWGLWRPRGLVAYRGQPLRFHVDGEPGLSSHYD